MLVDGIEILPGSGNTIGGIPREKTLTMPGELVAVVGSSRWYIPTSIEITSIAIRVAVAPTGSPLRVALKKNGVQVSADTLDVLADTYLLTVPGESLTDSSGVVDDYYTLDVVQLGAVIKGSGLTVQVNYVTGGSY